MSATPVPPPPRPIELRDLDQRTGQVSALVVGGVAVRRLTA